MIQRTTYTQADADAVREVVLSIPSRALRSDTLLTSAGFVLLSKIRAAFIIKSRGGTDEAGERWAPLAPATIAARASRDRGRGSRASKRRSARPSLETLRKEIIKGKGSRGGKRGKQYVMTKANSILFDKYGGKSRTDILVDTGELLESLSPDIKSASRVFRDAPGSVTIGTSRKWAASHHYGVPGKIPQRRLWPKPSRWPNSWWDSVLKQVQQGIVEMIVQQVRSAR